MMHHQLYLPVSKASAALWAVAFFLIACLNVRAGVPAAASSGKHFTLDEVANWKESTLNPLLDPLASEDALLRREIRPVIGHQHIDRDFITQGGDLQVYGIQLRW